MDLEVRILNEDNINSGKNVVTLLSLKILDMIMSIFSFATSTSVKTELSFEANCPDLYQRFPTVVEIYYPFDLEHQYYTLPLCRLPLKNATKTTLMQGVKTPAEFYVAVGVVVFLYCIVSLVLYIFYDDLYRRTYTCIVVDLVISVVFAILWIISSSFWAQGVVNLKYFTDLEKSGVFEEILDCKKYGCVQKDFPKFASLNVSIVFGFLNMLIWCANVWFLNKEAPWVRTRKNSYNEISLQDTFIAPEPL